LTLILKKGSGRQKSEFSSDMTNSAFRMVAEVLRKYKDVKVPKEFRTALVSYASPRILSHTSDTAPYIFVRALIGSISTDKQKGTLYRELFALLTKYPGLITQTHNSAIKSLLIGTLGEALVRMPLSDTDRQKFMQTLLVAATSPDVSPQGCLASLFALHDLMPHLPDRYRRLEIINECIGYLVLI
ncbi:hypothetical protein KIPB_015190, partial [Kipferlia bialata]